MYETIRLSVVCKQDKDQITVFLDMGLHQTCLDIKKSALEKIPGVEASAITKFKVVLRNKILQDSSKIQELQLKDNDKLHLISNFDSVNFSQSDISSPTRSGLLAPEHLLPKLTKDYHTEPSMLKISRMSEDELCHVENFSIYNNEARVTFEGETDIRGLDLDEIVHLGYRAVEIYPENGKIKIPEAGEGLNKTALIEFYNWPVPNKYENDIGGYKEKLRNWAASMDAQFKFYENDIVCIKVRNFNMKNQ